MNNKSILEAARKNKERGSEYELKKNIQAYLICTIAMLISGMILFFIDYFVKGTLNISLIIVAIIAISSNTLYQGITFKKVWKIILGAILCLIALIMIIARVVL